MKDVFIRFIGAAAAGSPMRSLDKDWNDLNASLKATIVVLPCLVALCALFLLAYVFFNWGGGSVLVYGSSEHVEYTALSSDPAQWPLPKGTVYFGKSRVKSSLPIDKGFLELACGDKVTLTRIGHGTTKLFVEFANVKNSGVLDQDEEYMDLDDSTTLSIDLATDSKTWRIDNSLNWAMSGVIIPGRTVKFEKGSSRGLLTDGSVEVYAKPIFGKNSYLVEDFKLHLGDQVVLPSIRDFQNDLAAQEEAVARRKFFLNQCQNKSNIAQGFTNIGSKLGINVTIAGQANHAEIDRYNTTTVYVGNSFIKRFSNDKWFAIAWSLIIAFMVSYRRIIRAILAQKYF